DQLQRLRAEPELLAHGTAIEELLRYTSPVQIATERYTLEPVTIGGSTIPPAALVFCMIGSANHDEDQFVRPDALDLRRAPKPPSGFGQGLHCRLGARVAPLEAQIAFETPLRRFPPIQLAVPPAALPWRRGLLLRGVERLPVRVHSASRAGEPLPA